MEGLGSKQGGFGPLTAAERCLPGRAGWRSLPSCRAFRLARMVLTSLDAAALSLTASLSLYSSCTCKDICELPSDGSHVISLDSAVTQFHDAVSTPYA